jgi:hypothetical protein
LVTNLVASPNDLETKNSCAGEDQQQGMQGPLEKLPRDVPDFGYDTVQTDNRAVNWLLYSDTRLYGPLGWHYMQEMCGEADVY